MENTSSMSAPERLPSFTRSLAGKFADKRGGRPICALGLVIGLVLDALHRRGIAAHGLKYVIATNVNAVTRDLAPLSGYEINQEVGGFVKWTDMITGKLVIRRRDEGLAGVGQQRGL